MTDVMNGSNVAKIRSMNDHVRSSFSGGKVMLSASVAALDDATRYKVFYAVQNFAAFTPDNDPMGEHDCALFEVEGEEYMFKMDYYDKRMEYGSEDPSDEMKTTRVLTIMSASDY